MSAVASGSPVVVSMTVAPAKQVAGFARPPPRTTSLFGRLSTTVARRGEHLAHGRHRLAAELREPLPALVPQVVADDAKPAARGTAPPAPHPSAPGRSRRPRPRQSSSRPPVVRGTNQITSIPTP